MNTLELSANELTFSAIEHGSGPLVLCLHGFPDCSRSFRHQIEAIADAGYRVVVPTMRGYEPSSQPADGDYSLLSLAKDIPAWLDQLGVERCHLVGHDWGAIVSYMVAASTPERLHSLTTLAIPQIGRMLRVIPTKRLNQALLSWYILFFQLPGLPEYVLPRNDWALIDKLWRDWSPGFELPAAERDAIKRTFEQPGVNEAALAYYRALLGAWINRESRQRLLAPVTVRTLAITGALDGCMDTRLYEPLMKPEWYPAGLTIERLADAGHFPHQERPEEVNRLLLAHFNAVAATQAA